MPDTMVNVYEAAKILGVSRSTVTRYKASGLLPYKIQDGKPHFYRDMLLEFNKIKQAGFRPSHLHAEVASLRYEVNRLQKYVKYLLMKQDLRLVDVDFNDQELLSLHAMSERVERPVKLQYIRNWVEAVGCLGESEYNRMAALLGEPYPWRRMFEFADTAIRQIKKKRGYKTNLELQQVATELALVQQEIRKCGLVLLTAEGAVIPATKRFDILMSHARSKEIDPNEIVENICRPPQASEADEKKLKNLRRSGSLVSLVDLPSGTSRN